jgi:branched-chain amino acid transport system substrate-binding protein
MGSIAQQIRTELKTETPKVALLAEKAVWTGGLIAAAQKNLPAMKMEVVGLWQPSATATDVTAELAAIDRAGAQIVFTMLSGPVGIVVGRQMGERNMKAVLY